MQMGDIIKYLFKIKHQILFIVNSHVCLLQAVQVTCIGEGPVVHVTPLNLEWGQVPVLNDIPKVVHLSNESLIPAKFTAHMVCTIRHISIL